ncbi:MAG: DUF3015 domain-containing protein [Proteobacteria bacterium]|nr:DUF3015 domain-containing protein [Pseudomonadota bacterium]
MHEKIRARYVLIFLGLLLCMGEPAYSRSLCSGLYVGGNIRMPAGSGGRGDELAALFLISTTSTTIYCISFDSEQRQAANTDSQRRWRYSFRNFPSLREEGAKGKGEHLNALAALYGCPSHTRADFAAEIQSHYRILFEDSSEREKERLVPKLDRMILGNQELKEKCGMVSDF